MKISNRIVAILVKNEAKAENREPFVKDEDLRSPRLAVAAYMTESNCRKDGSPGLAGVTIISH